jgi:glycosyltransferase involved in cell wall biosynthesis
MTVQEKLLFSIVIPTYNRAQLILKTIQSVLDQSWQNFEIIVIDDGSTDKTEEVVRSVSDSRLQYHRKVNAERGAARNFGTARSRGHYINFLDSDDLLYANHLAEAQRLIKLHEQPEIFHLGFETRKDYGQLLSRMNNLKGDLNDQLLCGNLLSCNGVFLRRDVATSYPFNEDRLLSGSEDWELWLRLASRFKIYYSNQITSLVVNHEQRSVLNVDETALVNRKNLILKYLSEDEAFVRKYGMQKNMVASEMASYTALHLALGGMTKSAWKYLIESLATRPASLFRRRTLAVVKHTLRNYVKGRHGD